MVHLIIIQNLLMINSIINQNLLLTTNASSIVSIEENKKARPKNDYDREKIGKHVNLHSVIPTSDIKVSIITLENDYDAGKKNPTSSSATYLITKTSIIHKNHCHLYNKKIRNHLLSGLQLKLIILQQLILNQKWRNYITRVTQKKNLAVKIGVKNY